MMMWSRLIIILSNKQTITPTTSVYSRFDEQITPLSQWTINLLDHNRLIMNHNIPKEQLRYYNIQSKSSGRVLDLCQDGDNKGKLIIYDKWGASNQQFGIVHVSPLEVLLVNRQSNLCLTVANNADKNGAIIIEEPPSNKPSQRFRLQEIAPGSGEYVIFTFNGKAFDCCENETKNNTRIIQWDFHAKDNQKWLLKRV